jgi:alpha-ketoglutarate-dependent taurine dioxygenase
VAALEEILEAAQVVAREAIQGAVQEEILEAALEEIHVAVQEEIQEAAQVAVSQDSTVITVHPKDQEEAVVAAETIRVNLVTLTSETGFEILLRPHSLYGWG